jgi:hypothetical protein
MVFSEFSKERGKAVGQRLLTGFSPSVELRAEHVMQQFAAFPFKLGRVTKTHAESNV